MIRQSRHILKYQTDSKSDYLNQLYDDYLSDLQDYIKLIISGELELKQYLSTSKLPSLRIQHSAWKAIIYKQASAIIRSQIANAEERRLKKYRKLYFDCVSQFKHKSFTNKKFSELKLKPILKSKYFTLPNIENPAIELDYHLFDIKYDKKSYFDEWVRIYLPYFEEGKHRSIKINLPIQQYKEAKKFEKSGWTKKKTIHLWKNKKNQWFIIYFYEKEAPELRKTGKEIGLDQGYYRLISDSNGNHYGTNLVSIYERIAKKKRDSKAYKRLLIQRDNEINHACNQVPLDDVKNVVVECLKYVKYQSHKKKTVQNDFMNLEQRWSYRRTMSKLRCRCEENGILFTEVSPCYTSQTCSNCGFVDKEARDKRSYHCSQCGADMDADTNAAINILQRGRIGS